jgi:hypothetical protein
LACRPAEDEDIGPVAALEHIGATAADDRIGTATALDCNVGPLPSIVSASDVPVRTLSFSLPMMVSPPGSPAR